MSKIGNSEKSIVDLAGLTPAMGDPETAAQKNHGRKAPDASFAPDLVCGSAGRPCR
jgi:hypothetical protein